MRIKNMTKRVYCISTRLSITRLAVLGHAERQAAEIAIYMYSSHPIENTIIFLLSYIHNYVIIIRPIKAKKGVDLIENIKKTFNYALFP